jgi:NADH-quinone oxidoreductase subunit M
VSELRFPWLFATVAAPLLGSCLVWFIRDSYTARKWCIVISGLVLLFSLCAWQDFTSLRSPNNTQPVAAEDSLHFAESLFGPDVLVVDALSAPLIPMAAMLYFFTAFTTLRTKIRRFSFASMLLSEAILLALLTCHNVWWLILLSIAGTIPPRMELAARGRPVRVYDVHMIAFGLLLVLGQSIIAWEGRIGAHSLLGIVPLLAAILIRSGLCPVHCWLTHLFEHATLGTSLLTAVPLVGAYLTVRLVLPVAPEWVLHRMGEVSLITTVYAAGMSLVQTEARRFFCYLLLSHAALVFVGLEMATPVGIAGALSVWLSVGLSLGGFGLVLRSLEARRGALQLTEYQGLYEHTPALAVGFLVTGLASVGFPGTLGFIGTELLIDGAVEQYPFVGMAVVIAAALNGISVVRAYFILFTGGLHSSSVDLGLGRRERFAVLTLSALIVGGGLYPQAGIRSRFHAAEVMLNQARRGKSFLESEQPESSAQDRGLGNNVQHGAAGQADDL